MIQLNEKYNREDFLGFLIKDFLPDFEKDVRPVNCKGLTIINEATYLGQSKSLDLYVFELSYSETHANKRVALATDGFRIMQSTATFNALIVFNPQNKNNWRLSLMTATPEKNEKGGVSVHLSNPRRYSFELGENTKINTPYSFLIKKGKLFDLDDLRKRFSIEVVNKEFYMQIAELFTELVGGTRGEGRNQRKYPGIIVLPSVPKESRENHEFAVRLIGRLIFCWFLREKKSNSDLPLISREILSLEAANDNPDYYHSILEPLFFEVLNKPFKLRNEEYRNHLFGKTPYLNGGLFTPQTWDYYDLKLRFILNIPDEWLRKLFEVLELYNFTVDENTSVDIDLSIDPEMLGRIFENLLAEINPETGETARKSTGSYYTPRTIVDYMVDESLIQYLKDKTSIDESKIRAIVSYDLSDDEDYPLNKDEKDKLIEALSKITILDPACGSGAFPIGALQKIVFILQRIDQDAKLWFKQQIEDSAPEIKRIIEREFAERNFDYIRKLGIIRQSIFGVDIQPIATEIARLRCFLTLVVDERVVDEEENRGIEPLPNLDFKFVTANSLIGLPSSQANSQVGLFEDQEGINKLKEVRDMYFNASGTEREQLKLQFVQIQNNMFQKMINEHRHAELTQKLSSWNPFGHEVSDWFDPDWMFGVKEGFDLVIGNPPYFQIQKLPENIKKSLSDIGYQTFTKMGDVYCLFYERGIMLTKNDSGFLCYITSNKWMRSDYGYKVREYFIEKTNPLILVDFGTYQNFGNATTYTNIILIQNVKKLTGLKGCLINEDYLVSSVLDQYVKDNSLIIPRPDTNIWVITTRIEQSVKLKFDELGTALSNWDISINYGLKTGLNDVYIIDEKKRNELISRDNNSLDVIKPVFKGRDIQKYMNKWDGTYLLFIPWHFPLHKESIQGSSIEAENEFQKRYPAVYTYLEQHKTELSKRNAAETGKLYEWYALQRWGADYYEDFEKDKIIWKQLAVERSFYLDTDGFYGLNSTAIMTGEHLSFLIALLNSKLIAFAYERFYATGNMQNDTVVYWVDFIKRLPLPKLSPKEMKPYEDIVNEINNLKKNNPQTTIVNYEKAIDEMLYKLYGLTPEEISVVEGGERNG